ncbi:MAG TPA: hypothetical protein VFO01_10885 [Trebonia sp.]|nr:hypothetical protein [Trebonia sp.]
MTRSWGARLGVPLAAVAVVVGGSQTALAAGGQTTPGVTVTAQNPGTSAQGSDLRITLTAHSEATTQASPSCRPQDASIQCWGSLVLRIPAFGDLTLSGLQVHRVAVGGTSCGGDEGGDSCGDMAAALRPDGSYPVDAQVNGLSVLTSPGNSGLPAGTQVQVKIALTDNGTAQYADTVDVQVNQFAQGMTKPLIYDTGPQTVQQVQIHYENG